ncbi:MAG: aminotransferase class IV [Phycisphaerae bacterium]
MTTMTREWVAINGELLPADQARVSVFDSGFMQGVGLFETMRLYNGRVFRVERHIDRLRGSAARLGWSVVPDEDTLRENVELAAGAIEQADARVRLTVTTGAVRVTERESPNLTIVATASPALAYPPEAYQRGVTAIVAPYRQSRLDPLAGHKATSYFARLTSLREAYAQSAFESIWLSDDEFVAEGAISNVFIFRGDTLRTPPLDTPVLPGITRAALIEMAAAARIPCEEAAFNLSDLLSADEAFLTNSMMEIVPLVRVGRDAIGTEKPGEQTLRLAHLYRELVQRETARD